MASKIATFVSTGKKIALNMHTINEVSIEHISRLDEHQLGQLLNKLLHLEVGTYGLKDFKISVPENEKSKDGGIDGKIEWNGNPSNTPNLLRTITAFQNKATDLSPSKCYEEILIPIPKGENQDRKLKPEIEEIVDTDGGYILFTTQPNTDKMNKDRVKQFREAIKDAGKANYASLDIRVFDANYIKEWVNKYTPAVDLVQNLNGITKPQGFKDWGTTEIDIKAINVPYQINPQISQYIQTVRDNIIPQKVIRIIGHSGIGKTRLILEAFRADNDQGKILNAQFVYCDIGIQGRYERLHNYITSHRTSQRGIIIVDNCDVERHNELSNLVKVSGEFKLISLGFDDSKSVGDVKIRIDRQNQRDLVRQIVEQQIGSTHLPQDIDYVTRLCEGYPWMAVRYCEVINKNGITEFDKFFEDEAIEKLVFGLKPVDHTELHVLRACSVFSAFGFLDDSFAGVINATYRDTLNAQTEFIRTRICDDVIPPSRFKEICLKFKSDDIIEQRGVYYIVKPTVLAIQLAAKWLTVMSFEKIKEIIEDLKTVQLEQKFLDRLTDLDQLDKAKDIVEELFGMNSSFGSAEVLKTEWGSLLFRYVVEVNPEATSEALTNAFNDWTKEDFLTLEDGRRNLVWALEKLCFHKETFFESTKLLYRFAISENERWANNASGQIVQLFQRFLAGTEADYQERIDILNWALEKDDPDYAKLALSCMSKAFIPQGQHHRSGGAENQGSGKPLVDFAPKIWDEVFYYWDSILGMLMPIINSNSDHSEHALKILARAVRTLIIENASEMLIKNLRAVTNRGGQAWMDVRSELQKALKYDNLNEELSSNIQLLLEEFQPKNLKEKFLANVILPEWSYDPPQYIDGVRKDKQQQKAEDFATYLINENIQWLEELPSLLEGEQRQGFNFGKKIGELNEKAKELTFDAIEALRKIDSNKQNPGFIMGLIAGIDENDFYVQMFQQFLKDSHFGLYSLSLSKLYKYPLNDILKLFNLVDSRGYPITIFDHFRFGKPLDYMSKNELEIFIDRVASYGNEGIATGFAILFMHCFQNEENWMLFHATLRKLIVSDNLLLHKGSSMEAFHWSTVVTKLLNDTTDFELAQKISLQLGEFSDGKNFNYGFDSYLPGVFEIIFNQYFDVGWPAIGEKLNADYVTVMHLRSMIGVKNGTMGKEGVLFKNSKNYDKIYHWAEENERGRLAIARMMPFGSKIEVEKEGDGQKLTSNTIHPFAKGFIDRFGKQEKVLNELTANLGSFGSVGGSESYFQLLMDLVSQLNSHKFREVKTWAKKAYLNYEKSLKLEKLENENYDLE